MPSDRLDQTLKALHAELSQSDALNDESREMLETVMRDITDALDRSDGGEPHSLGERLREAADHFEETHPRLTFAIGEVADVLSSIGI